MNCERCHDPIDPGEEREYAGRVLCEDCYMDALSPARTCDPWAVHSAKNLAQQGGTPPELSPVQKQILEYLQETGGVEPREIAERFQIKPSELEREIAALRHMEKIRAELREERKVIRLW
ncbi:MAG: hypothetical protein HY892_17705 [Deltaproteobacteria bacterium]|nr:hypothetical protein [Deltaproteobacteria bacterium]